MGIRIFQLAGGLALMTVALMSARAESGNLLENADFTGGDYHGWVLDPVLEKAGRVEVDRSTNPLSILLAPNAHNTNKDKPLGIGQMLSTAGLTRKTLTVQGAIKSSGAAGLILAFALNRAGKPVANVVLLQLDPSDDFRPKRQTLSVPPNAAKIIFAVATSSRSGMVWFSNLYIGVDEPSTVSTASTPARNADGAELTIDATHVLRTIPSGMFGTNVEWVRNANSLWDDRAEAPRPELVNRARQLGVTIVRYPGGGFADYYHWRDGVAHRTKGPSQSTIWTPGNRRPSSEPTN